MPADRRQNDRENRDLLIELKTQMANLTSEFKDFKSSQSQDFKDLKDNLGNRVDTLEKTKVAFNDIEALRSAMDTLTTALDGKTVDHETRIRFIERYLWSALGILAVIQFIGFAYLLTLHR